MKNKFIIFLGSLSIFAGGGIGGYASIKTGNYIYAGLGGMVGVLLSIKISEYLLRRTKK